MLKTLILSSVLSGEPSLAPQKDHRKLKNFAVSAAFIVAANLIVYYPLIKANMPND